MVVRTRLRAIGALACVCVLARGAHAAFAQDAIAVAPNVYVNCQWRVAAIFPGTPALRDISVTYDGRTAPAREFSFDNGKDRYSVTIADFTNSAPEVDEKLVEAAAAGIRQRGEVR